MSRPWRWAESEGVRCEDVVDTPGLSAASADEGYFAEGRPVFPALALEP